MLLVYPLAGTFLLLLTVYDIVLNTLSVTHRAPLSWRLGKAVWAVTRHSESTGTLVLFATAVLWVGLLWTGWTLVFMGAPAAVVSSATDAPAGFWERVYFAGYSVATLGLGDFVPQGPVWQALSVASALSGLVLLTLAVTFYTAVLSAVAQKQHLASLIATLGDTPAAMVAGAWDGERFAGLDTVLPELASLLVLHARRHRAYPTIHYFHTRRRAEALAVQTARLGDALLLLGEVVAEEHRPPPVSLRMAHRSLRTLVDTIHDGYVAPAAEDPPLPDLTALREAGIPLRDGRDAFVDEEVRAQRRILLAFVRSHNFDWTDVNPGAA